MSYQVCCGDKKILIKNIYNEYNNWLIAVNNYLKSLNTSNNKEEYKVSINLLCEQLDEMINLFNNSVFATLNIFTKLTFQKPCTDMLKSYINNGFIFDMQPVFQHFKINGFVVWLRCLQKDKLQISVEESKEILSALDILSPFFEDFDMFVKYNSKGKRDPFEIDIEHISSNFYLYPVYNECVKNNINCSIIEVNEQ